MFEARHGAFNGKLNGPLNAACFCVFLIKARKNFSKLVHMSLLWPLCA